jgi:hypothetical protein
MIGLPESSGGRISSFTLSILFHHACSCPYISWGVNNKSVGGRSLEMYSLLIDMMMMMIVSWLYLEATENRNTLHVVTFGSQ